ncbi:hypothetical protein [uncultured Alteromonas sp.]|jgi:hypothetical protein|uniref:hypothetical protein n=1 Tax=uncultured Alteromonas sp. TaxID=179113 RepID=UPI0025FA4CB3|nr:hypothetical protein [uncultured Alteromonas sp.]
MDNIQRYSAVLLIVARHVNTQGKQIAFADALNRIINRYRIDVVDRQVKQTGRTEFTEINETCRKVKVATEKLSAELTAANKEGIREIISSLYEIYTSKFYKEDSGGNRHLVVASHDQDLFEPMKEFLIQCAALPGDYAIQELLATLVDATDKISHSDNQNRRKGKDVVSSLTKKLIANLAGLYCSFGGIDSHSEKSIFPKLVNETFTLLGIYKDPHEQIREAKRQDYYKFEKSKFINDANIGGGKDSKN